MTAIDNSTLLRQQLDYYRARATEYDQWWLRQGRYDRGEALNAQWFAEAAVVSSALAAFRPGGRVLEFACGTGIWTEQLLPFVSHLTALDGSPEMLAINAARLRSALVRYVEADLFQWQPTGHFDTVFFGFWLSHVPPERFVDFWRLVRSCLAPGGRVFFVDSRHDRTSTAVDHRLPEPEATVLRRRLNDGREFQIYKVFYDPADLTERLSKLGWQFDILHTDHYFLYGSGHRRNA
jgi:demethylmenaquinone methyltransferase/2-methoxy-6-polyprenyl-1,4-benzoquinol methylase